MTDATRAPLTFSFFPDVATFELTSADVADGVMMTSAQVANGWGYEGLNHSPQLAWRGFPPETASFAVTIHDPDAPTGSGFWHWLVVNIPSSVDELATNAGTPDSASLPDGALQLRNDGGTHGYMGAAPPAGDLANRYVHTVHALDVERLEVDADSSAAVVGFNIRFHTLARAQIVPIFGS